MSDATIKNIEWFIFGIIVNGPVIYLSLRLGVYKSLWAWFRNNNTKKLPEHP